MKNAILGAARKGLNKFAYSGPKIVFIHIPKSGGTSLDGAIRSAIGRRGEPRTDPIAAWNAGRQMFGSPDLVDYFSKNATALQYLLCYHLNLQWNFVSGHFIVSSAILDTYSNYAFITVVRNPEERWRSNYIYNKVTSPDPLIPPSKEFPGTIEEEFDEVTRSGMGLQMGTAATSFLTGVQPGSLQEAEEASLVAAENLKRFSLVGTQDNLDDFANRLSLLVGKKIQPKRKNVTDQLVDRNEIETVSSLKSFLSSNDVSAKITEWCSADQKVYELAKHMALT